MRESWDFYESHIPVHKIGKYHYKAFSEKNAKKLAKLRKIIDKLCENLENNYSSTNQEYLNRVDVFLGIHKEYVYDGIKTSRYLISEIPPGTIFDGLDKPKLRYIDQNAPFVGKDGQGRALYRDIFLNLNLSDNALLKLVQHELAHTMANHIRYRPDDHGADFKWCEKLIKKYWPNN